MREWWHDYERVPFAEKGRSMEGADCWGLACLIFKRELNIILPDFLDLYEDTLDRQSLGPLMPQVKADLFDDIENPQPFDMVALKMEGVPMHVGVVTKPRHMIHCAKGVGTAHEKFTSMRWERKVISFGRYKQ